MLSRIVFHEKRKKNLKNDSPNFFDDVSSFLSSSSAAVCAKTKLWNGGHS